MLNIEAEHFIYKASGGSMKKKIIMIISHSFIICSFSSLNRCKLKNLVGVILSREVHVKAGKPFHPYSCNHHSHNLILEMLKNLLLSG